MTRRTVTAAQAKARAGTSSNAATRSSRNSRRASRTKSGAASAGTKRGKPRRPRPLKRSQVTNIAMTTGGEKRISQIILDGKIKEWVGIGWIDIRDAAPEDYLKIREVK